MTVARAGRYLEVAGGLGGGPPVAAGLPAGVLPLAPAVGTVLPLEALPLEALPLKMLPPEPPLQAATASPAATIAAIAGSREQPRSKPISLPLRLVDLHEPGRCRLVRSKCDQVA
jgi:hypothetical protein